jgi:hypothetical protein
MQRGQYNFSHYCSRSGDSCYLVGRVALLLDQMRVKWVPYCPPEAARRMRTSAFFSESGHSIAAGQQNSAARTASIDFPIEFRAGQHR